MGLAGQLAVSSARVGVEGVQPQGSKGRGQVRCLFRFPPPPPSHARVLVLSIPVSCMQLSALLFPVFIQCSSKMRWLGAEPLYISYHNVAFNLLAIAMTDGL